MVRTAVAIHAPSLRHTTGHSISSRAVPSGAGVSQPRLGTLPGTGRVATSSRAPVANFNRAGGAPSPEVENAPIATPIQPDHEPLAAAVADTRPEADIALTARYTVKDVRFGDHLWQNRTPPVPRFNVGVAGLHKLMPSSPSMVVLGRKPPLQPPVPRPFNDYFMQSSVQGQLLRIQFDPMNYEMYKRSVSPEYRNPLSYLHAVLKIPREHRPRMGVMVGNQQVELDVLPLRHVGRLKLAADQMQRRPPTASASPGA